MGVCLFWQPATVVYYCWNCYLMCYLANKILSLSANRATNIWAIRVLGNGMLQDTPAVSGAKPRLQTHFDSFAALTVHLLTTNSRYFGYKVCTDLFSFNMALWERCNFLAPQRGTHFDAFNVLRAHLVATNFNTFEKCELTICHQKNFQVCYFFTLFNFFQETSC